MTKREFFNAVANSKEDVLQVFLDALAESGSDYCVIGGLAVNAYVEPVVSLDLDIVVTTKDIGAVGKRAYERGFKAECFEHRVNLTSDKSDFRIQLQTDRRYQDFIPRSAQKEVMGYKMNVAALPDMLQGKIWAYSDETRRRSKRQKDLADILRLVEAYPELEAQLPPDMRKQLT